MVLSVVAALTIAVDLPHSALIAAPIKDGYAVTQEFANLAPGFEFEEMIASWNVAHLGDGTIRVEARAHGAGFDTKWYTLGVWSEIGERHSEKKQHDDNGTVNTDTLSLSKPTKSVDIRVTFAASNKPRLKLLTACFTASKGGKASDAVKSSAWGKSIDVPERAQGNYPHGSVLCSATSTSMLLSHYSTALGRPELDHDVPAVEASVWDPIYKGAGNWPFNTAFFGSFNGLRGYVARFGEISDLEKWIDAGFPVVCSVSFDLLRGLPLSPTESGHLVVLTGFTEDGDPIFNDPARKSQVRTVYLRDDFERGWLYSKRTVYLMYPDSSVPPAGRGCWLPD